MVLQDHSLTLDGFKVLGGSKIERVHFLTKKGPSVRSLHNCRCSHRRFWHEGVTAVRSLCFVEICVAAHVKSSSGLSPLVLERYPLKILGCSVRWNRNPALRTPFRKSTFGKSGLIMDQAL